MSENQDVLQSVQTQAQTLYRALRPTNSQLTATLPPVYRIDLKNADLIDGRWYKVSKAVTERCLSELENELVENLPLLDLSKFNAKITRPYGKRWDDHSGWGEDVDAATRERVVNSTRQCQAVVQLTYAFA